MGGGEEEGLTTDCTDYRDFLGVADGACCEIRRKRAALALDRRGCLTIVRRYAPSPTRLPPL
jgi:hypothetical protein